MCTRTERGLSVSVHQSVCTSVSLSVHQSVCPYISQSVCQSRYCKQVICMFTHSCMRDIVVESHVHTLITSLLFTLVRILACLITNKKTRKKTRKKKPWSTNMYCFVKTCAMQGVSMEVGERGLSHSAVFFIVTQMLASLLCC